MTRRIMNAAMVGRRGRAAANSSITVPTLAADTLALIDRAVARLDFAKFISTAQLAYIKNGDSATQDESAVTAAFRSMTDAGMEAMEANPGNLAVLFDLPPGGTLAFNDEMLSDAFQDELWEGAGAGSSFFAFNAPGVVFQTKNWPSHKTVRTSGYWAARGIVDPVPSALFRWESTGGAIGPRMIGAPMFRGELSLNDPIAVKLWGVNAAAFANVHIRRFRNSGLFAEGVNNSDFSGLNIQACGYQPTQARGAGFIPSSVTFSTTPGVGTTTIQSSTPVFDPSHDGMWFLVQGAGVGGSAFAARINTVSSKIGRASCRERV